MEFYKTYYVGFQKDRYSTYDDQRMLGFATYIDNTKAYVSRKDTIDRWRDQSISTIELNNIPRYGFQIVDTVTRYRTNNKLFRVLDPAGFELEISSENLFKIIETCTIVKGTIADPMIWARGPSKNYLISSNSEEYQQHLKPKESVSYIPKEWMKHKTGNIFYRYEGKFHYISFKSKINTFDSLRGRYYDGYYGRERDYSEVKTDVTFIINRKNDKSAIVYTEWKLDENGNIHPTPSKIHIRKSHFKNLIKLDKSDPITPNEYQIPLKQFLKQNIISAIGDGWTSSFMLFDIKQDALNMIFDITQLTDNLNPLRGYNYSGDFKQYGKITYSIEDIRG